MLTAADGTTRTIGSYNVDPWPMTLRVSPDRRQIAVVPVAPGQLDTILIVPTDGGPARTMTSRPQRRGITGGSSVQWATDGQALIIGDTQLGQSGQGERYRSRVLRCDLGAPACQAIPGVDGVATTIPGGIVTSSSVGSLIPFSPGLVDVGRRRASSNSTSFDLIGHEAASNAAVVVVHWGEERGDEYRYERATVRVPLDGRTPPSVISRTAEGEAW